MGSSWSWDYCYIFLLWRLFWWVHHPHRKRRVFHNHSSFQWKEMISQSFTEYVFQIIHRFVTLWSGLYGAWRCNRHYFCLSRWWGLALSTSLQNVTKSLLFDLVIKALSTHSSLGSNSLSTSFEELSCLISFAVVVCFSFSRGCLILSCGCSPRN